MVSKLFLCLSLLLTLFVSFSVCADVDVEEDQNVLVLTDDNFDAVIAQHTHILVEFYAPWCGHCKTLAPEYAAAAIKLYEEGSPLKLAKVDATIHTKLAQRFQIEGFPTLRFFVSGKPSEYTGGRTRDEILKWVMRKSGPPAESIRSRDRAELLKEQSEVSVFAYFETEGLRAKYEAVALGFEDVPFAILEERTSLPRVSDKDNYDEESPEAKAKMEIRKSIEKAKDFIILFKRFDERVSLFDRAQFDEASIREFVSIESSPLINEFSSNPRIFTLGVKKHFFLFLDDPEREEGEKAKRALRVVAKQFKGKAIFSFIDVMAPTSVKINDFFAIDKTNLPQVYILFLDEAPIKFKFESKEVDAQKWAKFAEETLSGKGTPHLKSQEPVPYQGKGTKVLVGSEHDAITSDPKLNVFVEYYAPWCGHCKNLAPIWDKLAESFDEIPNVVIAKFDATVNDAPGVMIQGFPTLVLYPATEDGTGKKGPGIKYEGAREFEDMQAFVELHGLNVPSFNFKTKDDDDDEDHNEL
jgi:protein disulfide-isomerase A1